MVYDPTARYHFQLLNTRLNMDLLIFPLGLTPSTSILCLAILYSFSVKNHGFPDSGSPGKIMYPIKAIGIVIRPSMIKSLEADH